MDIQKAICAYAIRDPNFPALVCKRTHLGQPYVYDFSEP